MSKQVEAMETDPEKNGSVILDSADIPDSQPLQSLILVRPGHVLFLKGKLTLEVLSGCVQCLGWTLNPGDPPKNLFSPRGTSLLKLECLPPDGGEGKEESETKIKALKLAYRDEKRILKSLAASPELIILLASKCCPAWAEGLSRYLPGLGQESLFGTEKVRNGGGGEKKWSELEKRLDVNLWNEGEASGRRVLMENPDWEAAVQSVLGAKEGKKKKRWCSAVLDSY